MNNLPWPRVLAGISLGTIIPLAPAIARETEPTQLAQVTRVSELSDVSPDDWAYDALRNLVEHYACLEGYPDQLFRGEQPISRYEFIAGLHHCIDWVSPFGYPQEGSGCYANNGYTREDGTFVFVNCVDLERGYREELARLRGLVDRLGIETAELRDLQFSTTTKLYGQVDAHVVVPFGDTDLNGNGIGDDDNIANAARAQLNFDSSFTGRDRLRIPSKPGMMTTVYWPPPPPTSPILVSPIALTGVSMSRWMSFTIAFRWAIASTSPWPPTV
jgi:hypothetical protein